MALEERLDQLVEGLAAADAALDGGDLDGAVGPMVAVAKALQDVPQFASNAKKLPVKWEVALKKWVAGVPFATIVAKHGKQAIEFVQTGVVFRLVWGFEAIRVHAQAKGHSRAGDISGTTSLALTYGAPSKQVLLLLQAGFPSRRMAMHLFRTHPAKFDDRAGLVKWLRNLPDMSDPDDWPQANDADVWRRFAMERPQWRQPEWKHSKRLHHVEWLGAPPKPGSIVRIIEFGSKSGVFAPDLTELGTMTPPDLTIDVGHSHGSVEADGRVRVFRFGPEPS